MYIAIPLRTPRLIVHVERLPLRWTELVDIQRRSECGDKFRTVDAIIGSRRIIVNVRRA